MKCRNEPLDTPFVEKTLENRGAAVLERKFLSLSLGALLELDRRNNPVANPELCKK